MSPTAELKKIPNSIRDQNNSFQYSHSIIKVYLNQDLRVAC